MSEWVFLTPHGHMMATEVLQKAFFGLVMVVSASRWTFIHISSKETIVIKSTGLMTYKRIRPI